MDNKILKNLKQFYHFSKDLVELIGVVFLVILVLNSIAYFKGGSFVDISAEDMGRFIYSNYMALLFIAIFIIYFIGTTIEFIYRMLKTIRKIGEYRDKGIKSDNIGMDIVKWLFKH